MYEYPEYLVSREKRDNSVSPNQYNLPEVTANKKPCVLSIHKNSPGYGIGLSNLKKPYFKET